MEDMQTEVLSMQQRRKRGMQLRRRKTRIKRQRQLVMRRFADRARISKRARRGARMMLKKRYAGGKSYGKLSPAQKMTVDRRTEKMKKFVSRVAARLTPQFRRKEIERKRGTKSEDLDLDFGSLFVEDYDDPNTDGLRMAEAQLYEISEDALSILEIMSDMDEEPDEWILSKITLASDYISTVRDYLEYYTEEEDDEDDDEEEYSESEMISAMLRAGKESFSEEEIEELDGFFEEYSSLVKKAERANMPFDIVLEVYNRGLDSYENQRFKTPQQLGFARVNSFIADGSVDEDLQEKVLEYGTDDAFIAYARATPGQNPDIATMKYDMDSVLNALNDINTQRIKKIHEEIDDEFSGIFDKE